MGRLPEMLKQEIELEIAEGTSLNAISNSYSIGKSTLYYYYKKIKGKKFVSPCVLPRLSEEAGEIVGTFAGDGSQYFEPKNYHYEVNVHFGGKKLAYASHVKLLFENFFRKSFRLQKEPLDRLRLRTYSKQIFLFFNNYLDYLPQIKHSTVRLKSDKFPSDFKIGFLRGLFDTDGCYRDIPHENRRRASFYTTSEQLAQQVSSMLFELNVKNRVYSSKKRENEKMIFCVNIWKDSVDTFINKVQPHKVRTGPVVKPGITRRWPR